MQMVSQNSDVTSMVIGSATLEIIKGDITKQSTDAIVNAANNSLLGGGGVDGAIHHAGGIAILEDCKKIVARQGRLPTGEAVITTAGSLPCKYVIHTVGPIWKGGNQDEARLLSKCYSNCLKLAAEHNLMAISFPSISTGVYRYPLEEAAGIALRTISEYMKKTSSLEKVVFVLFDDRSLEAYQLALQNLVH